MSEVGELKPKAEEGVLRLLREHQNTVDIPESSTADNLLLHLRFHPLTPVKKDGRRKKIKENVSMQCILLKLLIAISEILIVVFLSTQKKRISSSPKKKKRSFDFYQVGANVESVLFRTAKTQNP